MLLPMTALFLLVPALAHGPQEGPTHAASLDEHDRYELPDPLPAAEDCDAVVTIGTVEVLGSYNRDTIAAALQDRAHAVQVCYQLGLDDAEHRAETGRLVFQTTLYPSNLKTAFTIGTNTLEHPEVEDCVARVLKTTDLPAPVRGTITLSIPVDFSGRSPE